MRDEDFAAIFNENKNAVYQFAWRMSNSRATAEDVTQDVFLALLRGDIERDEARGSLRALLLGTARHLLWKRWRHEHRWSPLAEDAFVAQPLPFADEDREQAVAVAVRSLPPLQREALILATYNELSLRDIAEALGVETGTVKARLHRGRENLKRMLSRLVRQQSELGRNMEPMSDRDLDELLASWPAPDVPGNLERRMLDRSGSSWRSWLLRGTIQVPVPVAAMAMCLITLLFGWAIITPKQVNSRAERSAGLQPVKRLEIHIVRSNYESAP